MNDGSGKEVAETEVSRLLRSAGGSYVRAFDKLVRQAGQVARGNRSTVADRQKAWQDVLAKMDRHGLAEMRRRMAGYMALVKNHEIAVGDEPRQLDEQEQVRLMEEYLAFRDIDEFLKVRREWIRETVFSHITESLAAEVDDKGEPVYGHPEHENGRIEVPSLGKVFTREGCGPRDPELDENLLSGVLGDRWTEVCDVVYQFSPEKLMKLAEREPSILEKVKDCFVDSGWKPGRFVVRDL